MVFTRILSDPNVYHDGLWHVRLAITSIPKSQSYWFRFNTDVSNINCDGY